MSEVLALTAPAVAEDDRRKMSVIEMLEYVKSLGIDPVKESDLLWLGEDAAVTELPPNWSANLDEQCKTFYYNGATGESSWQNPLDPLFEECVQYWRDVKRSG